MIPEDIQDNIDEMEEIKKNNPDSLSSEDLKNFQENFSEFEKKVNSLFKSFKTIEE